MSKLMRTLGEITARFPGLRTIVRNLLFVITRDPFYCPREFRVLLTSLEPSSKWGQLRQKGLIKCQGIRGKVRRRTLLRMFCCTCNKTFVRVRSSKERSTGQKEA